MPKWKRKGQYQNLDFGHLKELSTIDMHLRYIVLQMCLDIEHTIKVRLLKDVSSNPEEDGYKIVRLYLSQEDPNFRLLKSIYSHKSGEYCKDLIEKYYPYFPVWVLVEIISFGDLLHLCHFYDQIYEKSVVSGIDNKFYNTVRDLRNASAHSNCLMNKMIEKMDATKQPDQRITTFVQKVSENGGTAISKDVRAKYMNIKFSYNITTLLYVYDQLMPIQSRRKRYAELSEFVNGRAVRNKDYFVSNPRLVGLYRFMKKLIDNLNDIL